MSDTPDKRTLLNVKAEFWLSLATVIVTVIVAMIGWSAAHESQLQADQARFRTNYLIEVTNDIAAGVNRDLARSENRKFALAVERAMEKIQFLGTQEQVDLVLEWMKYKKEGDNCRLDTTMNKLFNNLRDELRGELDRAPLDSLKYVDIQFLRFTFE